MEITAAVVERAGAPFTIRQVELLEPRPDEVLLRVEAVGVCHTDVKLAGLGVPPPPAVLGHEGAGVVEHVGATVRAVRPGDRIVVSFASCGECGTCRSGHPAYCDQFTVENMSGARPDGTATIRLDGEPIRANFFGQSTFATHAVVAERNIVALPDDIPFEIAAPMACGFQTGAGAVLNLRPILWGSTVLVFGAGAVGMGAVLAAVATGACVVVVDPIATRRSHALRLGAAAALDPGEPDLVGSCHRAAGRGFDLALDTSGVSAAQDAAFAALDRRGMLVLAAGGTTELTLPIAGLQAGKIVRGVTEGDAVPRLFLPRLFEMWRRGLFPIDDLITPFPLHDIASAVEAAHRGDVVKPVLLPHHPS